MPFRYVTQDSVLAEGTKVTARWSVHEDDFVRVYKRRWLMLGIFVLCAIANAVHWLQYSIISRIAEKYYGVSSLTIAWTAMMFSVTFIIFVFPALWMIERVGLKIMLILGDLLMIIGAWMKVASIEPELFYYGFVGQIIVGIAQVAIVNIPSYLAGMWFPANEVSTACAIGVIGTQIGVAIGFLVPPIVVTEFQDTVQMRTQFFWLYAGFAILPTLILPLIVFGFKNVPLKPPSYARMETLVNQRQKMTEEKPKNWKPAAKELLTALFTNRSYLLVVVSYSLILATYYCISTLLDIIFYRHFRETEKAGVIGTVFVVMSIFGCLFFGWILDKTHRFKLVAVTAYCFSIGGLAIFWLALYLNEYHLLFVSATLMGIFLASYVIIAIEFSSELTYPISETISTSILLSSGEFSSIVLIFMSTKLFERFGEVTVLYTTTAFMVAGMIVTLLLSSKGNLKRYEASFTHSPTPTSNNMSRRDTDQTKIAVKEQTNVTFADQSTITNSPASTSNRKISRRSIDQIKIPAKDQTNVTLTDHPASTSNNKISRRSIDQTNVTLTDDKQSSSRSYEKARLQK